MTNEGYSAGKLPTPDPKRGVNNPFVHEAVERMSAAVTDEEIFQGLEAAIRTGETDTIAANFRYRYNSIHCFHPYSSLGSDVPSALYLIDELAMMSSTPFWHRLFATAEEKDPRIHTLIVNALETANIPVNPDTLLADFSRAVSKANVRVFTHNLTCYGMAVIYGQTFPSLLTEESQLQDDWHFNKQFLAGREAAKQFPEPAKTPEEALRRLQVLFPNTSDLMPSPHTLSHVLCKASRLNNLTSQESL